MQKTTNAAGVVKPAASKQTNQNSNQDYTINPDKRKGEIHRNPIHLHRQPDNLPPTLKQLNQWCLSGHDKQPLNKDGYKMDVTDPSNYLSFDEATAASSKLTCAAGVGFVLTGTNIVTVDVDHCYQNGKFSQLAMELIKLLPTYTELSQSSTGLHFIYLDNDIPAGFTGKKGVIEIYADKRYIALTGWKLSDSTPDLQQLDGMTKQLLNTYFPVSDFNGANPADTVKQHSYPPFQSDEAVLQSLQSNQKFQRLYASNISGYPSQSEADGALMLILATATSLNADQMKRLFSQSALGKRDKWVNRQWYQNYLIAGAIKFAKSKENDEMGNTMNDNLTLKIYSQTLFSTEQNEYINQAIRKTGFPTVDKHMGFPPGMYCLAAINSAGKTAFSIQLGHQLAQQGESVIYVGYETTRLEVCSRILARLMKQLNPSSQFSAYDIRMGQCIDEVYYQEARQHLIATNPNFKVWSTPLTVTKLLEKLQDYMSQHPEEKPPIVVIDYLQIIPHTGDLKRMIDEDLPKIKSFQQSTGTTFLIISSANRASYHSDMGVEAFKESGVIEFSADVIWVLQYSALSSISTLDNTRLKLEKSRSPRKMTLKCLKNRFGTDYEVHFDYYSKFDWFVETTESTERRRGSAI